MTININLTGMDLAAAGKDGITALINACAAFAGASLGAEIEMLDAPRKTQSSEAVSAPEKVYVDEPIPAKPEQTAPAPIPTAGAPTYTVEERQLACAPLMDANRMADLQQVLTKFGATSLLDVPKEQYGALAADLRALGARL